MSTKKEVCTIDHRNHDLVVLFGLAVLFGILSIILGSMLNDAVFSLLTGGEQPLHHLRKFGEMAWIAGFDEEFVKDVLPLTFIFAVYDPNRGYKCVDYKTVGPYLGGLIGAIFGTAEIYEKLVNYGTGIHHILFWQNASFQIIWLPALLLHITLGIISGAILGRVLQNGKLTKKKVITILAMYAGLIAIHGFVFNRYIALQLSQLP